MTELSRFLSDLKSLDGFNALARTARGELARFRVTMMSYHHMPAYGAFDREPYVQVMAIGFPRRWLERYKDRQYSLIDPIPKCALDAARPFHWDEACDGRTITAAEEAYLAEFEAQNLGNGLAVPVFGPHARNGYVGLGCGDDTYRWNEADQTEIQAICQFAHLRYCELITVQLPKQTDLSGREREILQWMAQGKSNAVMAEILALSPNTVDTYVRRIFKKLKASDRVTAALRGSALGLLT